MNGDISPMERRFVSMMALGNESFKEKFISLPVINAKYYHSMVVKNAKK
jgi:hypothetical protein